MVSSTSPRRIQVSPNTSRFSSGTATGRSRKSDGSLQGPVQSQRPFGLLSDLRDGTSADRNGNSIPDECEIAFHRGDPDSNGEADLSDAIALFGFLFLGGPAPTCRESADVDNDGVIDLTDGIRLLDWLFLGGRQPPPPGPPSAPCGRDLDPPASTGDLGCGAYPPCN